MSNHWLLQFVLAVAMFVFTAIPGLASIKVTNRARGTAENKSSLALSLLSCFTGGVFLATCFLDIIPHVDDNYEKFKRDSSLKSTFPFSELMICVGFFAVYTLEEMMDSIFAKSNKNEYQTPDELALNAIYGNMTTKNDSTSGFQPDKQNKENSIFHAMVLAIVMSFHSILEGFALGVQTNYSDTVTLFISLLLHKGVESFSVGLQVARAGTSRERLVIVTILVYALMTPVGSITAVSIWNLNFNNVVKSGVLVALESLAVGTFIYATFLEIIAVERANEHSNICQMVAAIFGFTLIAIFQVGEEYVQTNF